jgi:hypothetical protein
VQTSGGQLDSTAAEAAPLDLAARLISEAAHDIRSPLAGIQAGIELIKEKRLGATSNSQQDMLQQLLNQCESIQQLVDNLLHFDRLRSGVPAIERNWFAVNLLPEHVERTLAPLAHARQLRIVWKGFDGGIGLLFGDPALLRRLLVNLVGNAITVSDDRSEIVIALQGARVPGMARLSVTDNGPGMTAQSLRQLALRGHSETGSSGLGLAISRALAALHFSHLNIRSEIGSGTEVSLYLPIAGPASVADAFHKWRVQIIAASDSRGNNERTSGAAHDNQGNRQGGVEMRIDNAPVHPLSGAELGFDGMPPRFPMTAICGSLRLGEQVSQMAAGEVDKVLQQDQQLHELVYRTATRRWVVLWDNQREEAETRRVSLQRKLSTVVGPAAVHWGELFEQSVGMYTDRSRVRELLVRDTLSASHRVPLLDQHLSLRGSIAGGSESAVERRLDEEVRRLNHLLKHQSERLRLQASRFGRLLE